MKIMRALSLLSGLLASLACQPKDNFLKVQSLGNSYSYLRGPKFTLGLANDLYTKRLVSISPAALLSGISDQAKQKSVALAPANPPPVASSGTAANSNTAANSGNVIVGSGTGSVVSADGSKFLLTSFIGATASDIEAFKIEYSSASVGAALPALVPGGNTVFTLTDFFPGPFQAFAGLRFDATKAALTAAELRKANRSTGLWAGVYSLLSATRQNTTLAVSLFSAPASAGAKILEDARHTKLMKELLPESGSGPRQVYLRNKDLWPGDLLIVYSPVRSADGSATTGAEMMHAAILLDRDVYLEQIETHNGYAFRVCRFEDILYNLGQNYNADVNELKFIFRRPLVAQFPAPKTAFAQGGKFWGDVTLTPEPSTGRHRISATTIKLEPVTFEVLSERSGSGPEEPTP